jgi:phenylacetate-CoA ligase
MSLSNRLSGIRTAVKFLGEFRRSQATHTMSPEELQAFQWKRTEQLLAHAYRHVPFYRRRFEAAGVRPADIRTPADLAKLPPLSKADIQQHRPEMVADNVKGDLYDTCSSGSTGEPTIVHWDRDTVIRHHAVFLRNLVDCGYRIGERLPQISGHRSVLEHPERIRKGYEKPVGGTLADQINLFSTAIIPLTMLSVFEMTDELMGEFAAWLRREQPSILSGYTIATDLFAQYLQRKGIDDIRPQGVVITAEAPMPGTLERLREVFGCPVYNRYATNEIGGIAHACCHAEANPSQTHVNQEAVLVEITRDGEPVADGETGRVLVTDLLNFAMPLIRYDLLDNATRLPERCPCGLPSEVLTPVDGRVDEFFLLPDDRLINAAFFRNVFHSNPGIVRYQVIQDVREKIEIKIIKDDARFDQRGFEESRRMIRDHLGADVTTDIEFVDHIEREAGGKFRYTVSRVYRQSLAAASREPEEALA